MTRKLRTTEVAAAAGVSRATVQHWIKTGKISAPALQLVDGKAVRLWTDAQAERARKLKGTLKPGPKGPRKKARRERGK